MTTVDLHESFTSLREETIDLFYKEINRLNKEIEFCQLPIDLYTEDFDNLDECLIVDIIDKERGKVFDVHVIKINKDGDFTGQCTTEYYDTRIYNINEIANEYDKIKLIEILEKL